MQILVATLRGAVHQQQCAAAYTALLPSLITTTLIGRVPAPAAKNIFLPEVESRTKGSRQRPRTQKKSEAKAKDSLSEDRHSRGQGHECSRPRTKDTSASALQKKKKKGLHKNFSGDLQKKKKKKGLHKNFSGDLQKKKKRSSQKFFKRSPRKHVFQKIFQALHKILTIQKLVLSSSRGQANFRGLEASRPRT